MIRGGEREKIVIAIPHMRIRYKMKRRNLEKVSELSEVAREKGSRVLVLPSLFHLGPVIDGLGPGEPRKQFKRSYAERIPGATTELLRSYAERNSIAILAGPIIERAGPRLYSTSAFITPSKGVISRYRKLVVSDSERGLISPGSELLTVDIGIPLGIMCEDDLLVPEIAHALSMVGSELLLVFMRFNEGFRRLKSVLISRAVENSVHVVGLGGIVSFEEQDLLEIPTMIITSEGEVEEEVRGFEERVFFLEVERKRSLPRKDYKKDVEVVRKVYSWLRRRRFFRAGV